MATTAAFNKYKELVGSGSIGLLTDTIKVLLVSSSYVQDVDAHNFVADLTNELGNGTTDRKTLTGKLLTRDDANDRTVFDADDSSWPAALFGTPDAAILYKDTGSDATSPLIAILNLAPDNPTNGATFTINWHATLGLLKFV